MTTTPQISPERTRNQSLAFGRNLIVLALLILILGALTLRWPRANATIIDANLSTFTRDSSEARTSDERPSFAVHYNYKVGGVDYFGGGVEPYDFGMQNSAGAQRMRDRHPIGSPTMIAYDPAEASVAYLEPGPSSFSLAMVGIGTVIGLSGLWVCNLAWRGIGRMET
jgi:hypothetical protein